jgi:excisionase family DNA binding protein
MPRTKHKVDCQAIYVEISRQAKEKNLAVIVPEGARLVGALKTEDAADYLSVSRLTLMRLVERGWIRPNRMTRRFLFPISELNRALNEGMVE